MPDNRRSALPASLREKLNTVGSRLEQKLPANREFEGILDGLNALPAHTIVRAEAEISVEANLHKWRRPYSLMHPLFAPYVEDIDQLKRVPSMEFLFIFHRDGFIREAALRSLRSPLQSSFFVAALAWRLNDWVAEVRKAAAECASYCLPVTPPAIIAEAALTLLARENSWGRWTGEQSALRAALTRPDVGRDLATILKTRSSGPVATVMRYALRESGLDPYLETLAREAFQPAVRALASQALIDGYAMWPSGTVWRWVDKSMGVRRRETTYSQRPLSLNTARIPMIEASANDPAVMVRRVAVSGIIRHEIDPTVARTIAESLLQDRSASVRERAKFIPGIRSEPT
jgi:hypothetical protein